MVWGNAFVSTRLKYGTTIGKSVQQRLILEYTKPVCTFYSIYFNGKSMKRASVVIQFPNERKTLHLQRVFSTSFG